MGDATGEVWRSTWSLDPWVVIPLGLAAGLYLVGWARLRRRRPARLSAGRALAFLAGLATVFVALCSPIDEIAGLLLFVHMTQHLLLLMVAAPLCWLGAPLAPMLRGLPRPVVPWVARGLLRPAVRIARRLAHPVTAWMAFAVTVWAWHTPALYELALRAHAWHHVEHASFLVAGLLFWWPVIQPWQPWPTRAVWPEWALIPYLALADVQNTALSAILTFADRVIYPTYAAVPRPWALTALQDQAIAGVIMWVPGSVAFLLPLGWLVVRMLAPRRARTPGGDDVRVTPPSPRAVSGQARDPRPGLSSRGTLGHREGT